MSESNLFPYPSFPIRLELTEESKICWFKDSIDLEKYLKRHKVDRNKIIILNANEQSIKPSNTYTKAIQSGTTKNPNGSTGKRRGRPKKLDSNSNISGSSKSKRKST